RFTREPGGHDLAAALEAEVVDIMIDLFGRPPPIDLMQQIAICRMFGVLVPDVEQSDQVLRILLHGLRNEFGVFGKTRLNERLVDVRGDHVLDEQAADVLYVDVSRLEYLRMLAAQRDDIAPGLYGIAGIEGRISKWMRVYVDDHVSSSSRLVNEV